jgi:hypothetical protein
MLTITPGDYTM